MNSPTLTAAHGTQLGVILGTAAYMAPEQAAGGAVDRRADIWSFGVVLYEMLTGRRLFDGETVSHVLAGVLKDTPDFSALPAATPPRIVDLVQRCLRKKPRERLQSIGDARVALEEVLADPHLGEVRCAVPAAGAPAGRRSPLPWILAAAGLVAAALFAALWLGSARGPGERIFQASLVAPEGTSFGDYFALSPDGRRVVFEAWDRKTGARGLWLRELDRGEATRLESTTGGETPFWSPDGSQIGFFADGKLKRLGLRGGPAQDDLRRADAAWRRLGPGRPDRLLARLPGRPLDRARDRRRAEGPDDARRCARREEPPLPGLPARRQADPLPRPDGGGGRPERRERDRAARPRDRRADPPHRGEFLAALLPAGQLLFWRDGTLFAQRFDAGSQAAGRARADRLAGELHPERAGPRHRLRRRDAGLQGGEPRHALPLWSGSTATGSASRRCARTSSARTSPSPRRPTSRRRGQPRRTRSDGPLGLRPLRDAASRLTFDEGDHHGRSGRRTTVSSTTRATGATTA